MKVSLLSKIILLSILLFSCSDEKDDSSGEIEGCDDINACNFNQDVTIDDGSCEYAEPNYDCDGNQISNINKSVSLSISSNYDEFVDNYNQNITQFMDNISTLLSCDYSQVNILSIESGSVIINFEINTNSNDATEYIDDFIALDVEVISDAIGYDVLEIAVLECDLLVNDEDNDGICDTIDNCLGELDSCGICNGGAENYLACCDSSCFELSIESTGLSNHITFHDNLNDVLHNGDIISVFDLNGITNSSCFSNYGLVLVGVDIWDGSSKTIPLIGSADNCDIDSGSRFPGYISGNDMYIMIYRSSEDKYYHAIPVFEIGSNTFGDGYYQVESLTLQEN